MNGMQIAQKWQIDNIGVIRLDDQRASDFFYSCEYVKLFALSWYCAGNDTDNTTDTDEQLGILFRRENYSGDCRQLK